MFVPFKSHRHSNLWSGQYITELVVRARLDRGTQRLFSVKYLFGEANIA